VSRAALARGRLVPHARHLCGLGRLRNPGVRVVARQYSGARLCFVFGSGGRSRAGRAAPRRPFLQRAVGTDRFACVVVVVGLDLPGGHFYRGGARY
jgi:hypothetical protein